MESDEVGEIRKQALKKEGFYNLQVSLSYQSPNIALPCRKSLNRWPCWDLTESVPLVLWLLALYTALAVEPSWWWLWALFQTVNSFDSCYNSFDSCYNSFDSSFKVVSFAKKNQAEVWPRFWIIMNWILDWSKLLHGFVKNITFMSRFLPNKTNLVFDLDFAVSLKTHCLGSVVPLEMVFQRFLFLAKFWGAKATR